MSKVLYLNPEYICRCALCPLINQEDFIIIAMGKSILIEVFWIGGPIAMLINKNNYESLLYDFY
jgi:hypothetical protein